MACQLVLLILCAIITSVVSQYGGRICEECGRKYIKSGHIVKLRHFRQKVISPRYGIEDSSKQANLPNVRKSHQECLKIAEEIGQITDPQILGGESALIGEFPHMAALGYKLSRGGSSNVLSYSCGGSLISDQYVLTSAHCLNDQRIGPPVEVRLGKVDIYGNSDEMKAIDFNISKIIIHPNYDRKTKHHDIGLIKLSGNVRERPGVFFRTVIPACLCQYPIEPPYMSVTGWGKKGTTGDGSTILLKANLSSVPFITCKFQYLVHQIVQNVTEQQFCAKSESGTQDTCEGDSGGPIQILSENGNIYHIIGITSYGKPCDGKFPGVYTKVYSYLDWIENIVWPRCYIFF